jgi:Fe-S-cluster-containing dehydrogenase component
MPAKWPASRNTGWGSARGSSVSLKTVRTFSRFTVTTAPTLPASACPVNAISKNADGIVLIDRELCIGCRECLPACPFGAMQFDDDGDAAVKCDLCIDRLSTGMAPACSSVCGTQCIAWGSAQKLGDRVMSEAVRGKI